LAEASDDGISGSDEKTTIMDPVFNVGCTSGTTVYLQWARFGEEPYASATATCIGSQASVRVDPPWIDRVGYRVSAAEDTDGDGTPGPYGPEILVRLVSPFDFDHDGIRDAEDTCPTVWNPDRDPSMCEPLGAGWLASRPIVLSQAGGPSTWRRTNEPVEVSLVNGFLDSSVVAWWPLDNGEASDASENGNGTTVGGGVLSAEGAFGDGGGGRQRERNAERSGTPNAHGLGEARPSRWRPLHRRPELGPVPT
jgi:hypothetical protein